MRQGLYTSIILHSFVGLLLLTNFQLLESKPDELLSNVSVKLLSEKELLKLSEMEATKALEVIKLEPESRVDVDRYPKKPEISPKKNIGNEIKGVSQNVIDLSDNVVEITQYGTKHSLNVSVSAGIVAVSYTHLTLPTKA